MGILCVTVSTIPLIFMNLILQSFNLLVEGFDLGPHVLFDFLDPIPHTQHLDPVRRLSINTFRQNAFGKVFHQQFYITARLFQLNCPRHQCSPVINDHVGNRSVIGLRFSKHRFTQQNGQYNKQQFRLHLHFS